MTVVTPEDTTVVTTVIITVAVVVIEDKMDRMVVIEAEMDEMVVIKAETCTTQKLTIQEQSTVSEMTLSFMIMMNIMCMKIKGILRCLNNIPLRMFLHVLRILAR